LKNVEDITTPLAERSEEFASKVDTTLTTLNYALEGVGRFTDRLNDSEGTVAQLLNKNGDHPFTTADEKAFREYAEPLGVILESCLRMTQIATPDLPS
jgi:hypothetical protein